MTALNRLAELRSWKLHGRPGHAAFSGWTFLNHRAIRVSVRQSAGETLAEMLDRAVEILVQRQRDGMPKPRPDVTARRKLREAVSSSRHVN
jgi:hypothetical protein